MSVYLPLQGPNGERPKAPAVAGWQSPSYQGIQLDAPGRDPAVDWIGLRCDGIVVVDCDSEDAAAHWRTIGTPTLTRKTPRGFHFIYVQTPGSPDGPAAGVYPGIDIRAGRTSQIVYDAPGYRTLPTHSGLPSAFDHLWLPARKAQPDAADEWSEMPRGRGNVTMTAIAGALRKQGMDYPTMLKLLLVTNKLTMTEAPMSGEEVELIARSVNRYAPDPDVGEILLVDEEPEQDAHFVRYLDSKRMKLSPPPEWLWHPYLPKGRMVLVEGTEGIGKGFFGVWLAMRAVTGSPYGEGMPRDPASVLWYSAEDDPQEDILRRMHAAGYDPERHESVRFYNQRFAPPTFPKDIEQVRKVVEHLKPGLIILDPGRSFLAPPNDKAEMSYNNDAVLRPGLQSLLQMTHDLKTSLVFIHHWNKRSEGTSRDKSGGSVVFRQVVRHVVVLAQVGNHRALSVEKSNIAATGNTVRSYDVEEAPDFESARFTLGGALPQYTTIDEWIETVKKLDAEEEIDITWAVDWQSAAMHYANLTAGGIAPTAGQMAHDLGVSQELAQLLRSELRDARIINGKLWSGLPPDLQSKAAGK